MPHCVFLCLDCLKEFSQTLPDSEFEEDEITCPKCGGRKVAKRVEPFAFISSKNN